MTLCDVGRLDILVEEYLMHYVYSNMDLFIQGLLVREGRIVPDLDLCPPGYCYQHNEKFLKLITSEGFDMNQFKRKKALVVKQFDGEANEVKLHAGLISHDIILMDNKYIIDVGFGEMCIRGCIPFNRTEEPFEFRGETFKFQHRKVFSHYSESRDIDWWGFLILVGDRWLELWRFPAGLCNLNRNGVEELNNQLTLSEKDVRIRDNFLLFAKVSMTSRTFVVGSKGSKCIFKVISNNQQPNSKPLTTWNSFKECAANEFGIVIPEFLQDCFTFEGEK